MFMHAELIKGRQPQQASPDSAGGRLRWQQSSRVGERAFHQTRRRAGCKRMAPFAAGYAPRSTSMTPADIFHREIGLIHDRYTGLLDGDHDSIHRARIATRRVREILPLTHEWQNQDRAEELRGIFKRMGRSLGRVRDTDTRISLLRYLEARIRKLEPYPGLPIILTLRARTPRASRPSRVRAR